jgi:hypothetical protein
MLACVTHRRLRHAPPAAVTNLGADAIPLKILDNVHDIMQLLQTYLLGVAPDRCRTAHASACHKHAVVHDVMS